MIDSIPLSAVNLGIGHKEYEDIARNIHRVSLLSLSARISIIERAEGTLPSQLMPLITNLQWDMAGDRKVYPLAELEYSQGPPKGQNLFATGIADYLMRFYAKYPEKTPSS